MFIEQLLITKCYIRRKMYLEKYFSENRIEHTLNWDQMTYAVDFVVVMCEADTCMYLYTSSPKKRIRTAF